MECTIGLFKTELIKPREPWRSLADVELATAEYVNWYNNKRLHMAIGGMPPTTLKTASDEGWTQQLKPPRNPGAVQYLRSHW